MRKSSLTVRTPTGGYPRWQSPQALATLVAALLTASLAQGQPSRRGSSGEDGNLTVTESGAVLNEYVQLGANASRGATTLLLPYFGALDSPLLGPLGPGDLLLIIQMQGASIDTTDTPAYGTVTSLNSAGLHEFVTVGSLSSVGTNTITVTSPLQHSYSSSYLGRTQVIRVPQFASLTIEAGASVTADPFSGLFGGVVVLQAQNITLNGTIDVSGMGFRGGSKHQSLGSNGTSTYRSSDAKQGAEKGESIACATWVYDSLGGRYGRGAPANGGGGGNARNAGGGGGANGNSGNLWTGHGVMSASVTGAQAWMLDPGYLANGNSLTSSSGGGRGGYDFSSENADALSVPPGDPLWGGSYRREVGGLGGHPLGTALGPRLFLGGGGGAGDGHSEGSSGGSGGGLVYLDATTVTGTGRILANGAGGQDAVLSQDGCGGGGGGGTIFILSDEVQGIFLEAKGGRGGRQLITTLEADGPGGGGGGGFIAWSAPTAVNFDASGGEAGTTGSASLSEFPSNGATFGATTGRAPPPDFSSTLKTVRNTAGRPPGVAWPGDILEYTVTTTNGGPDVAIQSAFTDELSAEVEYIAGSLKKQEGAAWVAVSDAADGDDGEYDASSHMLTVRLGSDIVNFPGPQGGRMAVGASARIVFQVRARPRTSSSLNNQARVRAFGELSGQPVHTPSRFDSASPPGPTGVSIEFPMTVGTPANGALLNTASPSFDGIAVALSSVIVRVDGEQVCTATASATGVWSCSPPSLLPDGRHNVTAQAFTVDGYPSPVQSLTFFVDTVSPAAPLISIPGSGAAVNAAPVFAGTVEPNATLSLILDGASFGPVSADGAGSWNFTAPLSLAEGAHSLGVTATDLAGNVSPEARLTFTLDQTAPETLLSVVPDEVSNQLTATFVFGSTEAGLHYECSVDGVEFSGCVSPASFQLSDGKHFFAARARDAAGNVDASPATHAWEVDTVAPSAPELLSPAQGARLDLMPWVSGTAEPGSTVKLSLDGAEAGTTQVDEQGTWRLVPSGDFAPDAHVARATATDKAGNTSAPSSELSFSTVQRSYYRWSCSSVASTSQAGLWALVVLGLRLSMRRKQRP